MSQISTHTLALRRSKQDRTPIMAEKKTNETTAQKPYEPVSFAKKHRISVEDARSIIEKHGADRKNADKEGRRVSV
ncbi:hypothetical protein RvVAR0630_37100 [Agrobacterium vitis]|nr:hypothetical protein RvVAR0630_37100 [Agrobacterium vitis]